MYTLWGLSFFVLFLFEAESILVWGLQEDEESALSLVFNLTFAGEKFLLLLITGNLEEKTISSFN